MLKFNKYNYSDFHKNININFLIFHSLVRSRMNNYINNHFQSYSATVAFLFPNLFFFRLLTIK